MRAREYAGRPIPIDDGGDGHRPTSGFMFQGQATSMPIARPQGGLLARRVRRPTWAALSATMLDVATSVTGIGLAVFLFVHMGLLSSVLWGATSMDALGSFLERYYLLHSMAPLLILLILAHVLLVTRKAPTTFRQQWILVRQLRQMGHLDTWTWAFQVVSGAALMVFVSIHLWLSLTDLPIEAAKSGDRVSTYLWFDILFVLFVVGHACVGLYRIAVKWGLLSRRGAYGALAALTAAVLALEFAIVSTFYSLGGGV
jgi:fumarate reductase subunit C